MKQPPEIKTEDLLDLYAQGNSKAAALLTQRLLPGVYRQAVRLIGDGSEAEDIAQEAMLRLWRIAPDWRRGEAKVTTWLYRVTANLCTDQLRKRRNVALAEIDEPMDEGRSAAQGLQERSRDQALRSALTALPERQREAVVLRHLEGMSNPQIAEIMDITPRAVESLTARGKRSLAALLSGRRAELGYENDAE